MGVRAGLSGPLARQRRRVRIPDGILGQPAHCIGVEVELHRKAAHRYEAILADVDPVLSSAGDSAGREVQWLGQVLAAIPSTIEHRVFPLGPTWSGR